MNKRIRELAHEAGYKHPDAVGRCEDYAYFDHKKFAELIVRECAGIFEGIYTDQQRPNGLILESKNISELKND